MGAINEVQGHFKYSQRLDQKVSALAAREETTKSEIMRRAL